MKGLDKMMSRNSKDAAHSVERLYYENTRNKQRIGKLLGELLQKKYHDGTKAISFDELLIWELWPSFIKIYGMLKILLFSVVDQCG